MGSDTVMMGAGTVLRDRPSAFSISVDATVQADGART